MQKRYLTVISTAMIIIMIIIMSFWSSFTQVSKEEPVALAVEYNNHAACAYIAKYKGWFKREGLNITYFNTYVTGLALAAALTRGDIDAAYICLGPAIMSYVRGVPIKVVCGTHYHGYVVVGKSEIKTLQELEGKRIGCVREGSPMDLLLHIVIKRYDLKNIEVRRANPPKQVMLLWAGLLDVIFVPEHWATLASSREGYHVIARSQELWLEMEGSVLVVKERLIQKRPEVVKSLVKVTEKAINFINKDRIESAEILCREFAEASPQGVKIELISPLINLITPERLLRSMNNLEYTTKVDVQVIQQYINLMYKLGYLDRKLDAKDIVDLRFLSTGP